MKNYRILFLFALVSLVISSFTLASCTKDFDDDSDNDTESTTTATDGSTSDISISDDSLASSDLVENFTVSDTIYVSYSGSTVSVVNNLSTVISSISNADVSLNSTASGVVYVLSGTTTDGSFKLYSTSDYELILSNVSITNSDGPALNLQSESRALTVLKGTNTLVDGSSYATSSEDQKATLFAEGPVIISGSGSLGLNGYYKHAICSDTYFALRSGTITVSSATTDGIHANDYVNISGGTLNVSSTADAIECEAGNVNITGGDITLSTTKQKSDAINAEVDLYISGGTISCSVSGGGSKALKSSGNMSITGGDIICTVSGAAYYDSDDLDIASPAGINCDGSLEFSGATLSITSTGLAGKGISVDGTILISSGTITVKTTGKQYTYSSTLDSSPKGIKADGNIVINGGTINVTASGGEGSEGIESKNTITINAGTIEITSYDDGINASSAIVINGGNIYSYASNNDGIDSNGTLTITGGLIISSGTTAPEEGFDCDQNTFKITGGILIGTGGATSTPTSSACTQRSIVYSGSGTSGQYICLQDASNNQLLIYKIPRTYSQMTLLYSSSSLSTGTYTLLKGGTLSGGTDFHGYITDGTYSGGTQAASISVSSMVTTYGSSSTGRPF